MNDLVYLQMFRDAATRPMVLHYFLERKYGIETLIKYAASTEDYPLPDYSSWVLTHLVKEFPAHLQEYQPMLIDAFMESKNQTVLRNLSAGFIHQPLVEHRQGEFYDALIQHLLQPENKVALHVNCIYKLIQFSKQFPELTNEIWSCIEILTENNKQASLLSVKRTFQKKCMKSK